MNFATVCKVCHCVQHNNVQLTTVCETKQETSLIATPCVVMAQCKGFAWLGVSYRQTFACILINVIIDINKLRIYYNKSLLEK